MMKLNEHPSIPLSIHPSIVNVHFFRSLGSKGESRVTPWVASGRTNSQMKKNKKKTTQIFNLNETNV